MRAELYSCEPGEDARGVDAFFTAAFERDRWHAVRQSGLVLLALFGVPCWLMAAWPGVWGETFRKLSLASWSVLFLLVVVALLAERRWQRVLEQVSAPSLDRDAVVRELRECMVSGDPALATVQITASRLGVPAVLLAPSLEPLAAAPPGFALDASELAAARLALAQDRTAGLGGELAPDSPSLCLPMRVDQQVVGVLAARLDQATVERVALLAAIVRAAAPAFSAAPSAASPAPPALPAPRR
jgi:K+-sensing histidine kinase KdpD